MLAEMWGDISSAVGTLFTAFGVFLTIWVLRREKNIETAVKAGVDRNTKDIQRAFAIADVSATIAIAQEIKRLHRLDAWPIALARYPDLRTALIRFRHEHPLLTKDQLRTVQAAITQIGTLEDTLENSTANKTPPNVPAANRALSDIIDGLEAISAATKLKGN